ncbi:topoisomerase DNA-binding C4 zinc finger domain-containing protein [Halolamina sp.]|jgi:DNA topoisomerase-1|uniref:topoisomerase DNA-binding C4 zinc finger domain-containing protein n=1 Tax=Halolamina sp. TaxID=1940283 RepID=UPI0035679284
MTGPPRHVTETVRLFAGDCTVTFEGERDRTQRGYVLVVVKPDRTVLVHDAAGYQPVAWLTRADEVTTETEDDSFSVTATAGDQRLHVVSAATVGQRELRISEAGAPVGSCPDCGDALVRTGGDVVCLGCDERYGLPAGATVLEESCPDCGLPTMRVERGEELELCLDWRCESLADAVADVLDGRWDCPDCGEPLGVVNRGNRPFLGCDAYPACETTFSIPAGVAVGECSCGLPVFETAAGRRCLDGTCDRFRDHVETHDGP